MTHGLPASLYAARFELLALYLAAVGAELVWRARRGCPPTSPRLIVVTMGMWLTELSLRGATFGLRLAAFSWAASLAPVHLPPTVGVGAAAYLMADFIYYWKHRLLHRTALGWALHAPHHSSDTLTLLAAVRLGWVQRLVDDLFFLPLALLGVPPTLALFVVLLNEVYPGWCHLGLVGPLPWLDGWLNTPMNHRAHHAADRAVGDSNYGSTLMVWDRLFGTYRRGEEGLRYGLPEGPVGLNPVRVQLGELGRWLRRLGSRATTLQTPR